MDMRRAVSYTPYDISPKEKTGDIITFAHFEQGDSLSETHNLLSEICDNTGSGNEYDDNSTMPPLISEVEMDIMSSGEESDAEPMSMEMLEDICDGNQSRPSINNTEACYKIFDFIKRSYT